MGMLPTKGLTLPLMSAGGSAIMAVCLALGMVLRVNFENHLAVQQARPSKVQNKLTNKVSLQSKKIKSSSIDVQVSEGMEIKEQFSMSEIDRIAKEPSNGE